MLSNKEMRNQLEELIEPIIGIHPKHLAAYFDKNFQLYMTVRLVKNINSLKNNVICFIFRSERWGTHMLLKNTFCMLMTIGFILSVFVTDVMGEDLTKYTEDEHGNVFYYEKDSIERKSGMVKVWTENRFDKKNEDWSIVVEVCKKFVELNSINDCNKLSHVRVLYEINCKEDKYRFLSFVLYDENGKVLYSSSRSLEWDHVIPDTNTDKLKNHVCK